MTCALASTLDEEHFAGVMPEKTPLNHAARVLHLSAAANEGRLAVAVRTIADCRLRHA
jgi:hypothetical protein